jgi:hypothetical protein
MGEFSDAVNALMLTGKPKRKRVCIDVDDTILQYDGWQGSEHFGEPFEGAADFLRELSEIADICLHSTRTSSLNGDPEVSKARMAKFFDSHGLKYHEIHSGPGKPAASAYVDDKAVTLRPKDFKKPKQAYRAALAAIEKLVGGDG